MKREELVGLGMSDDDLVRRTKKLFDVAIDLDGYDDAPMQRRRRMWFDNVMTRDTATSTSLGNRPIGAFGADDPATHFGKPSA